MEDTAPLFADGTDTKPNTGGSEGASTLARLTATADYAAREALARLAMSEPHTCVPAREQFTYRMVSSVKDLLWTHRDRTAFKLHDATNKYEAQLAARMGRTVQALGRRDRLVRGPFTYQVVYRDRPSGLRDKREIINGETTCRQFLSFLDADQTLAFLTQWYALQRVVASPAERITLLECGSYDDTTLRKWTLDIDATCEKLEADGYSTDPDVLLFWILCLGFAFTHALWSLGFAERVPVFAVVSRHSAQKRSWHVTLDALGSYDRWREAIALILETRPKPSSSPPDPSWTSFPWWEMLPFVDEAILSNSKSQYIQVWGSTKVNPGQKFVGDPGADASASLPPPCFQWEGVWSTPWAPVALPDGPAFVPTFLAATSLMLHDPWSVPFSCDPRDRPSSKAGGGKGGVRAELVVDPVEGVVRMTGRSVPLLRPKQENEATNKSVFDYDEHDCDHDSGPGALPKPPQTKQTKKRARCVHKGAAGTKKSKTASTAAPTWDPLPSTCQWMRRFVELPDGSTRLTYIPSMTDPKNWPDEASHVLAMYPQSARVLVHAYVTNTAMCPKFLVVDGCLHRHRNNKAMVFCIDDGRGTRRMFMRCFSQKCSLLQHERCLNKQWIEVFEEDYDAVCIKMQAAGGAAPSSSSSSKPTYADLLSSASVDGKGGKPAASPIHTPPSPHHAPAAAVGHHGDTMKTKGEEAASRTLSASDDELIDDLLSMSAEKEEQAPKTEPLLPQEEVGSEADTRAAWIKVPAAAASWMRPLLLAGCRLRPICPPLIKNPPKCIVSLLAMKRAAVLLYASVLSSAPPRPSGPVCYCPRIFKHKGERRAHTPSASPQHQQAMLVVSHTDPRCPGTSYRLFFLCLHPECCHLRSEITGAWVELSRDDVTWLTRRKSSKS